MRKASLTISLMTLLRVGLGGFFVYNSISKLHAKALWENAEFMTACSILPEFFSMPLTCIGIMMELVVGVCLLFRISYRGAAIWGTVMSFVFFFLFVQAWMRGLELSCACSGETHKVTDYPMDTGVRLLLLGAMLLLVWDSMRQTKTPWKRSRHLDFSEA